jgi:hypothetical protein
MRRLRIVALTVCLLALGPLGYAASGAVGDGSSSLLERSTTETEPTTESTTTDTTPTTTDTTPTTTDTTPTTTDTTPTTTAPATTTVPSPPPPPPPPEPTPPPPPQATTVAAPVTTGRTPPEISNLRAVAGDALVRLTYELAAGVDHVTIRRSTANGDPQTVYEGNATSFTDRGLANGVEYRYVVRSADAAGNSSLGVAIAVTPRRNYLRIPKDGARLRKPPKLVWTRNAQASYYNVQLFLGEQKILSAWPVGASFKLKPAWKYQGRRYTLTKGVYRWYVWPGFGARSAVDYGELLGSNSFQMTR